MRRVASLDTWGFDGICCVAGAKNLTYNLPLSVMITLVLVTVLYIVAAFALTGMQLYSEISTDSGFPEAVYARGVEWAAQLAAFGEIFTLPVVVVVSPILQPRLLYACERLVADHVSRNQRTREPS